MDKKKKAPKPGSKRAQNLVIPKKEYKAPKLIIKESTIFLLFSTAIDLKKSLERVHHFYEKSQLKGPLKGVNMPISVYNEWSRTVELSVEEVSVQVLLNDIEAEYLIGCLEKEKSTILHEWCHAYYFFHAEYREFIQKEWDKLDESLQSFITQELELRNYHSSNFIDEFQAYVRESPSDFGKKNTSALIPLHHKLIKLIQPPF